MRILVHDFGGYAFALHLSHELASRGHSVSHAYCGSHQTTPPGIEENSCKNLELYPLCLREPLNKYDMIQRWKQEREYGRLVAELCVRIRPDVVLSGNAPLNAQQLLIRACRNHNTPVIYWLQDLIGEATFRLLTKRMGLIGWAAGRYFKHLESRLLRKSSAVITITEQFVERVAQAGVAHNRVHVIRNWSPIGDAASENHSPPLAKKLSTPPCFLYTGTLSMKHNPELIVRLAKTIQSEAQVVVISQGMGAEWLKKQKAELGLPSLTVLPYQPKEDLPSLYASASVLIAVLEEDASIFSVPSKVLTYLAAGKPILLAVPPSNQAARIVTETGAGVVVSPNDIGGFCQAAQNLCADAEGRLRMGRAGRQYAERTFRIDRIGDRFLNIIGDVT